MQRLTRPTTPEAAAPAPARLGVYSAHVQTFISLTHSWTEAEDRRFYTSAALLDMLLDFSKAEGDFEWAVAYHPYPESLFGPRTWEDEKVSFTLQTPLITFKNIEVLAVWARQPRTFYNGTDRRVIHLSEQGFHSKDYSEASLLDFAAAMAYAWKEIQDLPEIEAFQYHGWVDIRGEGGLRLGLRKYPDDKEDPLGTKPIWHVYKALETTEEDNACAFALKHIGIENWGAIHGENVMK